jgi:hypothetical protein
MPLSGICLVPYGPPSECANFAAGLVCLFHDAVSIDRLREICAKLRTASTDELEDTLQELLALVHRKAERLKARAGRLLLQGEQLEPERRKSMM